MTCHQNSFVGMVHEDPIANFRNYYEIAGSLGASNSEEESVFVRLFTHSLIGKAKDWYRDKHVAVDQLEHVEYKFINFFYPQSKVHDTNTAITGAT